MWLRTLRATCWEERNNRRNGFYYRSGYIDPFDIDTIILHNKAFRVNPTTVITFIIYTIAVRTHANYYAPTFSTEHVFTSYVTNMRPSTCINVTDVMAGRDVGHNKDSDLRNSHRFCIALTLILKYFFYYTFIACMSHNLFIESWKLRQIFGQIYG